MVDVIRYINIRNGFLYGELEGNEIQPTSDAPVYIDYVRNPSTIRVLINGKVDTVDFKTYCKRAAADAAVEATYNYFLLDYYGAFFQSFIEHKNQVNQRIVCNMVGFCHKKKRMI